MTTSSGSALASIASPIAVIPTTSSVPAIVVAIISSAPIVTTGGFDQSCAASSVAAPTSASAHASISSSIAIIPATSSVSIIVAVVISSASIVTTGRPSGGFLLPSTMVFHRRIRVVRIVVPTLSTTRRLCLPSRARLFGWTVVLRVLLRDLFGERCFWKGSLVCWWLISRWTFTWSARRHLSSFRCVVELLKETLGEIEELVVLLGCCES